MPETLPPRPCPCNNAGMPKTTRAVRSPREGERRRAFLLEHPSQGLPDHARTRYGVRVAGKDETGIPVGSALSNGSAVNNGDLPPGTIQEIGGGHANGTAADHDCSITVSFQRPSPSARGREGMPQCPDSAQPGFSWGSDCSRSETAHWNLLSRGTFLCDFVHLARSRLSPAFRAHSFPMRSKPVCPSIPRDGVFQVGFKRPERRQSPEQGKIVDVLGHQPGTLADAEIPTSATFELTGLPQELMELRLRIVHLFHQ